MNRKLLALICAAVPLLLAGCETGGAPIAQTTAASVTQTTAAPVKSSNLFSTRAVTTEPATPESLEAMEEHPALVPHPDAELLRTLGLEENEVVSPAQIHAALDGNAFSDAECWWSGNITTAYEGERTFICADGSEAAATFLHRTGIGPVVDYGDCLYAETQLLEGKLFFILPTSDDCDVYSRIPSQPLGVPAMNYDLFVPVISAETQRSDEALATLLAKEISLPDAANLTAAFTLDTYGVNVSEAKNEMIYSASLNCPPAVILDCPFYYGLFQNNELIYFGRYDSPTDK